MSERELVKLVTVESVMPVENSDNLEVVSVGGWNVVSQKGLYKPGDSAWYFEIDSLLPLDNPAFAFLEPRGVREVDGKRYHRLKTVKLRGQISQGLLVPVDELSVDRTELHQLGNINPVDVVYSVSPTEQLGVLKFDDVVTVNAGNGDTAGSFPTQYGSKTDAERIQNLKKFWDHIKAEEWIATEKIDGCSLSVFRDLDGNLRVCSRNWEVKDGGNVYWNAVRQYEETMDFIYPGSGIQAEIYGDGIQNNRLGLKGKYIKVFNFVSNGQPKPVYNWPAPIMNLAVPEFPGLVLPDTVEEAIAQADGIKSTISKDRLAEGIVWTHADAKVLPFLGRHCFKVVSNKWLLKNE